MGLQSIIRKGLNHAYELAFSTADRASPLESGTDQSLPTETTRPAAGCAFLNKEKTMLEENIDTREIAESICRLSEILVSTELSPSDTLSIITIIDTLGTMLARWYYIR